MSYIQYFLLIVPEFGENFDNYELTYTQLIPHAMDTIFIILELINIKDVEFVYLSYHYIYIIFAIIVVCVNKLYRDIWSYNLFIMTQQKGWIMLAQTCVITQISSILLFGLFKSLKFLKSN